MVMTTRRKKNLFTDAELAEIAAADAEIDAAPITQEERDESRRRDYIFRREHLWGSAESQRAYREANREKIAESQRAYYEANREKIAESKRAYYEANREKIAESQRAYYEANREKIAESKRAYREANREKIAECGRRLKLWRVAHGLNQTQLGARLDMSQSAISLWESGSAPIDYDRIERICPEILEAFEEDLPR